VALWRRRSSLGLLGSHVNVTDGAWVYGDSGIAGGIDSFFEYLLKAALLLHDDQPRSSLYLRMFHKGIKAIKKYNLRNEGWYFDVHMDNGGIMFPYFRSLQSFWPGLLTLYGDVGSAEKTFAVFYRVWKELGFVPEALDVRDMKPVEHKEQYPLRPELGESAFYLWRATKNNKYRKAGLRMIESLNKYARTSCGFAAVENVVTKELRDHMDSYFLAETLKYLYMLFDESADSAPFRDETRYVFNTEAHPFPLPSPSPATLNVEGKERKKMFTSIAKAGKHGQDGRPRPDEL